MVLPPDFSPVWCEVTVAVRWLCAVPVPCADRLLPSAGIGVPIMLAYVYGVVPISLCRSGGCGVSAGNGKGVRIEFDDENDINVGGTNAAVGKNMLSFSLHVGFVTSIRCP